MLCSGSKDLATYQFGTRRAPSLLPPLRRGVVLPAKSRPLEVHDQRALPRRHPLRAPQDRKIRRTELGSAARRPIHRHLQRHMMWRVGLSGVFHSLLNKIGTLLKLVPPVASSRKEL